MPPLVARDGYAAGAELLRQLLGFQIVTTTAQLWRFALSEDISAASPKRREVGQFLKRLMPHTASARGLKPMIWSRLTIPLT